MRSVPQDSEEGVFFARIRLFSARRLGSHAQHWLTHLQVHFSCRYVYAKRVLCTAGAGNGTQSLEASNHQVSNRGDTR